VEWNPEHLAVLARGVGEWNKWRRENPYLRPDLEDADLRGLDLSGATFSQMNLVNVDLRETRLVGVNLIAADVNGSRLMRADLSEANCISANFFGAQLAGASLAGAVLDHADMRSADLSNADLSGARLIGTILIATPLRGANFSDARIGGAVLGDVDLTEVLGLERVSHLGPSINGADTLIRSKGQPTNFLRDAGVPNGVLSQIARLAPAEFWSCFVSYSSADAEFSGRLHADLASRGVPCWFAPEDLKIGDRFRHEIEKAIPRQDKLLLVLSTHSITSAWVESEVEHAFELERKSGRAMLMPITIDGAILSAEQAWAAEIRRTRQIGRFDGWRDGPQYEAALQRLLSDLSRPV